MKKLISLVLLFSTLLTSTTACGIKSSRDEIADNSSRLSAPPNILTSAKSTAKTTEKKDDQSQPSEDKNNMVNPALSFSVNPKSGGLDSITIKNDPSQMNWCGNTRHFGEIYVSNGNNKTFAKAMAVKSITNSQVVFENDALRITVHRSFDNDGMLNERYVIKNITAADLFLRKGDVGIYVSMADEYKPANVSLSSKCNQHVWFGENIAWINALRQGPSDLNLGLVLLEGSIDSYSMDRDEQTIRGNRRSNLILNPEINSLLPNEEYIVSWKLFTHTGTEDFFDKLTAYGKNIDFRTDFYTVIGEEHFRYDFLAQEAKITCDGIEIPFTKRDGRIFVDYQPHKLGEHIFKIQADGLKTHVSMFASPDLETLIENRVNYIVEKQQYHNPDSALDGAYLIYDTKEDRLYYSKRNYNHNACRERIGMALLIARYLQANENPKAYDSLMKYVKFAFREFIDENTGEVFNSEDKDGSYSRLYNAPWAMMLMAELYKLTKDTYYLNVMVKIIRKFYEQGGKSFYPNAVDIELLYGVLKDANMPHTAEVKSLFRAHVEHMLEIGLNYPPHEAIYEQTIVTPAVTFITQYGLITGDLSYGEKVQAHLECLQRFDGMQPDYRLNGIPTRYWDDFWFGKTGIYSDTLHYWSCLSANSYNSYYRLSGDATYKKKADNCIRNCLCLFMPDGAASCAYLTPYRIDSYYGECYDDWANDQDFALYYAIQLLQ